MKHKPFIYHSIGYPSLILNYDVRGSNPRVYILLLKSFSLNYMYARLYYFFRGHPRQKTTHPANNNKKKLRKLLKTENTMKTRG